MKILLLYKIVGDFEKQVFHTIKDLLVRFNHPMVSIPFEDLKAIDHNQFSLILICNTFLSENALNSIKSDIIPKVLIIEESKISRFCYFQHIKYNKIIILKDQGRRTNIYLPKALTELIQYPFCLNEKRLRHQKKNKHAKVVVAIKCKYANELIIRLAPIINLFSGFNFIIISDQQYFYNIFNPNIIISDIENLSKNIEEADFLIGNGICVLQALLAKKPAIVVGENGYGGFITPQIIDKQYQTFFSGRIGGEIMEHIPPKLLIDDIITISELEVDEIKQLTKLNIAYLEIQQVNTTNSFINILLSVIRTHTEIQSNLLNCTLRISSDFGLIPIDQNRFVISMITNNYSHSMVDKEGFEIIQQFRKAIKVLTAMKNTGNTNEEEEFKNFIVELLSEGILTIQ